VTSVGKYFSVSVSFSTAFSVSVSFQFLHIFPFQFLVFFSSVSVSVMHPFFSKIDGLSNARSNVVLFVHCKLLLHVTASPIVLRCT